MAEHRGLRRTIMNYMAEHEGEALPFERIAEDTGMTRQQATQSLSAIVTQNVGVRRIMQGVYQYDRTGPHPGVTPGSPVPRRPRPPKIGEVYECIGATSDGTVLVRSESGTIYKLAEM